MKIITNAVEKVYKAALLNKGAVKINYGPKKGFIENEASSKRCLKGNTLCFTLYKREPFHLNSRKYSYLHMLKSFLCLKTLSVMITIS